MSIEQPVHRQGLPPRPALHPGSTGLPAYPHATTSRGPAWVGYPAPPLFGGRPLHPATPPAGLTAPGSLAPFTSISPLPPPGSPTVRRGGPGGAGLAVVGVVVGSVALVVSWVPWVSIAALALAAGGLICGVLALRRASHRRGSGVAAVTVSGLALLIALAMSALCVLGIAAGPGLPRELGEPAAPISAGPPSRGVSNDSPRADRVFLQLLHNQDIALADTEAVRLGRTVCGRWVDGADLYTQAAVLGRTGLSDFDTGFVIGAATRVYCPAYQQRLRG